MNKRGSWKMSRSRFTHRKHLRAGEESRTQLGYSGSLRNVWTPTQNIEFALSAMSQYGQPWPWIVRTLETKVKFRGSYF